MQENNAAMLEQLQSQLAQSHQRLVRLEERATEEFETVSASNKDQISFVENSASQIKMQTEETEALEEELLMIKRSLSKLSISFRELCKKELVDHVEDKVNSWQLESFISREEFSALLTSKINNRF